VVHPPGSENSCWLGNGCGLILPIDPVHRKALVGTRRAVSPYGGGGGRGGGKSGGQNNEIKNKSNTEENINKKQRQNNQNTYPSK